MRVMQVYSKLIRWLFLSIGVHFLVIVGSFMVFFGRVEIFSQDNRIIVNLIEKSSREREENDEQFQKSEEVVDKVKLIKSHNTAKKRTVTQREMKFKDKVTPLTTPYDDSIISISPCYNVSCPSLVAGIQSLSPSSKGGGQLDIGEIKGGSIRDGDNSCEKAVKLIESYLRENLSYPNIARQMQLSGSLKVKLKISKGGLSSLKVVQSSGYDILDENAVETLKKVKNLPPCDKYLIIPIEYRLVY